MTLQYKMILNWTSTVQPWIREDPDSLDIMFLRKVLSFLMVLYMWLPRIHLKEMLIYIWSDSRNKMMHIISGKMQWGMLFIKFCNSSLSLLCFYFSTKLMKYCMDIDVEKDSICTKISTPRFFLFFFFTLFKIILKNGRVLSSTVNAIFLIGFFIKHIEHKQYQFNRSWRTDLWPFS